MDPAVCRQIKIAALGKQQAARKRLHRADDDGGDTAACTRRARVGPARRLKPQVAPLGQNRAARSTVQCAAQTQGQRIPCREFAGMGKIGCLKRQRTGICGQAAAGQHGSVSGQHHGDGTVSSGLPAMDQAACS